MMNFEETKIRVNLAGAGSTYSEEEDNLICSYASDQIRSYLKTFGQLPKDKQVFNNPDYHYYYIDIDAIDPIENMIICFVDFSAS